MSKRMLFDAEARDALRRGFDQLADTVRLTLGPRGRNVVLDRATGSPAITNDGVTIAREIELADPFENLGARLGREIGVRTQQAVGDGTTTSVVLAQAFVREGTRVVAAGVNPMALKRGMDRACARVVSALGAAAVPISGEEAAASVAALAAGEGHLGELIAEALARVGAEGSITVEDGRGLRTELSVVEGTRFERGYLSPYFVTDPERMEAVLEDAWILVADRKIEAPGELLSLLELVAGSGKPLLVVAEAVEGEALATLVVNRLRGTVRVVAVQAPGYGERRRENLDDLALLTGATVITPDAGRDLDGVRLADLGRVERAVITREATHLLGGGGTRARVEQRAAQLRRTLADPAGEYDRERVEERLARLVGGVAVIAVGGATETEIRERRGRVADALAATRAAVAEGVVPGGGLALLRAAASLDDLPVTGDEAIGVDVVRRGLAAPLRQIADNAGKVGSVVEDEVRALHGSRGYDAAADRMLDLTRSGVLDPAKVVRLALQHAVSIAGMILTTQTLVVEVDDDPVDPDGTD